MTKRIYFPFHRAQHRKYMLVFFIQRFKRLFIRLRQNTPWLAAGMNGGANLAEAR